MERAKENKPSAYNENAMTETVCLVCGEHIAGKYGYIYRGKAICRGCLDYIRMQI